MVSRKAFVVDVGHTTLPIAASEPVARRVSGPDGLRVSGPKGGNLHGGDNAARQDGGGSQPNAPIRTLRHLSTFGVLVLFTNSIRRRCLSTCFAMKLLALRRPEVRLHAPPRHNCNNRVRFARVFFGRNTGSRNRSPLLVRLLSLPRRVDSKR